MNPEQEAYYEAIQALIESQEKLQEVVKKLLNRMSKKEDNIIRRVN